MISHRPPVIVKSDWIILLEAGNVQLQGIPQELKEVAGEHQEFLSL